MTMKMVMFSFFNFTLELIFQDKFQTKVEKRESADDVEENSSKISSKLKLKEENITIFIICRLN